MAFTVESLADLERAIATGARAMKYKDREITLRTMDDIQRVRRMLRAELGLAKKGSRRVQGTFDQGLGK